MYAIFAREIMSSGTCIEEILIEICKFDKKDRSFDN